MTFRKSLLIPLAVFILLCGFLALGFRVDDPHHLPSMLIGKPLPDFALPDLHETDKIRSRSDLLGKVALVNVWGSWCPNCIIEHSELMRISREEQLPIYGINYRDDRKDALKWLEDRKDPYKFSIMDLEGRLAIDLGVYGAPETFVIDSKGVIQFRHVGSGHNFGLARGNIPCRQLSSEESRCRRKVMNTRAGWLIPLLLIIAVPSRATIDAYPFPDEALAQRYDALIAELRCPQCLNTNLAGSDAMIARDLRREVHRMLLEGQSDEEILAFMQTRYGDFILYRPEVSPGTLLLWFGPLLLVAMAAIIWWRLAFGSRPGRPISGRDADRLDKLLSGE